MASLRQLAVPVLGSLAALSTCLPVQYVDAGHPYGHSCEAPYRLAEYWMFVPALTLALVAVYRLRFACRAPPRPLVELPRATLPRGGWRSRAGIAAPAIDARVCGNSALRPLEVLAACAALLLTIFLAVFVDGPGRWLGFPTHLPLCLLALWPNHARRGTSPPAQR